MFLVLSNVFSEHRRSGTRQDVGVREGPPRGHACTAALALRCPPEFEPTGRVSHPEVISKRSAASRARWASHAHKLGTRPAMRRCRWVFSGDSAVPIKIRSVQYSCTH